MNLNFSELEVKAAEQSEANAEAFRRYLEAEKERESRERAKLQDILTKAGERVEADAKADMEAKIAAETKKAEAEIKAKYAKEHGASEWNDDQVVPLKNMLGSLMGGKR